MNRTGKGRNQSPVKSSWLKLLIKGRSSRSNIIHNDPVSSVLITFIIPTSFKTVLNDPSHDLDEVALNGHINLLGDTGNKGDPRQGGRRRHTFVLMPEWRINLCQAMGARKLPRPGHPRMMSIE